MSIVWGPAPLSFRPIARSACDVLQTLDLSNAERFLEPLSTILAFVRRGLAHRIVAIETGGELAGFYVVHPDRRDPSCWWLGWLAIDARRQGGGIGRAAVAAVMAALGRDARCRRVRLLVAPDNAPAMRLYRAAGFHQVDTWAGTGELVMERACATTPASAASDAVVVPAMTLVLAMCIRLWRRGMPPAARLSGEFHGPPPGIVAVP